MNKDFHYYGTYVAARLAGYDFSSAELIAHAAQYVDDSDVSKLKDEHGSYYINDFTPIPTVHTLLELGKHTLNMGWTEAFLDEVYRVWPVFHFLPGNFDADGNYRKDYMGAQSDSGQQAVWEYDEEAKEQFKLMCLPDSILVKKMVSDLNSRSPLHEIGLRMHTLADTWAHTYYSGIPAWFNNNVSEGGGNPWLPNTPYYNSFTYLGHCRAGSFPDYPYKNFTFKIQWSRESIVKDNPSDFLKALKQMTEALSCIRTHRPFDVRRYADIGSANEAIITSILNTCQNDQSGTWKENIKKIKVGGKALEIPADYDPEKWVNAVKSTSGDIRETDYYKFNAAAVRHLHFVKTALAQERLFLDDIPQEHIIKCQIKVDDSRYISPIIYKMGNDVVVAHEPAPKDDIANEKLPYASVGQNPVVLELVFPNDDTLKCGTNIKIRTTENNFDHPEYKYLGAWKWDTYLYYYTKDYYLFKQKWCIEQPGSTIGTPIDLSKPITLKNKHFTDKPYLQPYDPSNNRLTTRKAEHAVNLTETASPGYLLLLDNYDSSVASNKFVQQAKICYQALVTGLLAREQVAVVGCTKYGEPIYPKEQHSRIVTLSGSRKEAPEAGRAIKDFAAWRNENNLELAFSTINDMLDSPEKKYYILFTAGKSTVVGLPAADTVRADIPLLVHAAYPTANEDRHKYEDLLARNKKSEYYSSTASSDVILQCHRIKETVSGAHMLVNEVFSLSGSYYQEKEFRVDDHFRRMQISLVWSDPDYHYTAVLPNDHTLKVSLIEPSGARYPAIATFTGGGFCLFDITDIPTGKWKLLIEYVIPTNISVDCGMGVFLYTPNTNFKDTNK